jgi:hypothetical protein
MTCALVQSIIQKELTRAYTQGTGGDVIILEEVYA